LRRRLSPAIFVAVSQTPSGAVPDAPTGVRRSTPYFPELESLRGIACTLVALYHVDAYVCDIEGKGGIVASPLSAFIRAGHTGVNVFFILSAFLLSIPFLIESAGGKRVVRRSFYTRRALRILPLYYLAVAFGTVMCAQVPADLLLGLPHLLFLNATTWFYTPGLMPYRGPWWTLATEMQFYALLPLLPLALSTRRGRWFGAALLVAYAAAYVGYLFGVVRMQTGLGEILLGLSLFGHAWLFLFGIAAAWLYLRFGERLRTALGGSAWLRNGGADLALLAAFAALGLELQWATFKGFWAVESGFRFHAWHLADGLLWTVVVLLLLLAPLRAKRLFSNPVWNRLGVLSYSIYLWHYPIYKFGIDAFRSATGTPAPGWNAPTLAAVAVLSGACVLVSSLTYRFVERPFLARKQLLE
jgi:peptidoglycan/LPS O-acetylase OafA/YrhL